MQEGRVEDLPSFDRDELARFLAGSPQRHREHGEK
jgi:hypothetical protein